jgi:hypothetical protein
MRFPLWLPDAVTPRAAISSCLSDGADENRVRSYQGHGNPGILESFVTDQSSLDPLLHFMAANAEFRLAGVPVQKYPLNWNGLSAHSCGVELSVQYGH